MMNKITPVARTYDEWKALGYQVVRGQKATSWTVDGKARFDREQVKYASNHEDIVGDYDDEDFDWGIDQWD